MASQLKIKIVRKAHVAMYPFTNYFKGFEKVAAVRQLFGEKTEEVLRNLKVEFNSGRGYMGVSGEDGHLRVSANYLNNGDIIDLYLDVIHELVHVKQFMEGKELRDRNFGYVDRPTEIEAFLHAVNEGKRLGMSHNQILEYLQTERMNDEELNRLVKALKLEGEKDS